MKLINTILIFLLFNACDGWYIAGYELNPNSNEDKEFQTLIQEDSTSQWEIE